MGKTTIEWTDRTWSPLRAKVKADAADIARAKGYTSLVKIAEKMVGHIGPHCEHVSHGCDNCYSDTNNHRCLPSNGTGLPFDRRSRDLIDEFVDMHILKQPLHWKNPQRIFVENQSDLFGEWVQFEHIKEVFQMMALCHHHTFQILSKRQDRMFEIVTKIIGNLPPLANVHLGVSVEDQKTADARIPLLLWTPAAVRFVSYEPALEPVDFSRWLTVTRERPYMLDQIIIGGESGPGARPFDIEWARETIRQCKAAGVACFVKQLGVKPYSGHSLHKQIHHRSTDGKIYLRLKDRKGGDMAEWPEDLRVRESPKVR